MAAIRVTERVYSKYGGKPFSALIAKLENPQPLLREIGVELLGAVRRNLAPHVDTGTLISGFSEIALYSRRGNRGMVWGVGLGDPKILGDPTQTAPKGTIRAFVDWLRGENKGLSKARRERLAEARAKRAAERGERTKAYRSRMAEARKRRRAEKRRRERRFEYLTGRFEEEIVYAAASEEGLKRARVWLFKYRRQLSRYHGYSYKQQSELAEYAAIKYYGKFRQAARLHMRDLAEFIAELGKPERFFRWHVISTKEIEEIYNRVSAVKVIRRMSASKVIRRYGGRR